MLAADPVPAVVAVLADKPAGPVIISRYAHSDILTSKDTPLPLIKGRKTEDAILRQAIYLTSTFTVQRPGPTAGQDVLHWTYEPYLQHQLCFTSMTGVFSCAAANIEGLTEKVEGEGPLAAAPEQGPPKSNPEAERALAAVTASLGARADALFEDDRRKTLSPVFKASGVSVRRIVVRADPDRR